MRISDWSSDVCSSDLAAQQLALAVLEILRDAGAVQVEIDRIDRHLARQRADQLAGDPLERVARDDGPGAARGDRKSVGEGQSGSVRVDLGGRRIVKIKKKSKHSNTLPITNESI